jgi:hypothetical protein
LRTGLDELFAYFGMFLSSVTKTGPDGKPVTTIEPVSAGSDAMAVVPRDLEGFRAEVEFERVIMKSSSGGRTVKSAASPAHRAQTVIGGS